MIIVKGEARFGDGEVERLRGPLAAWVREARERDGCLSYRCGIEVSDPDCVFMVATWRDEAALDAHMASLGSLMQALAGAQMLSTNVNAYKAEFLKTTLGD